MAFMNFVNLEELETIVERCRKDGKKIVLCHGCFDLLHIGHIRYLREAKSMGDVLVVTISPDHYVDKGPNRPAFNEILRAEAVASLDCVDYVAINRWPTAEETLRLLRPDVYVKGSDFKSAADDPTGKLFREEAVVREVGAVMAFTNDIVFSSTTLINRFLSSFPEEIQQYLSLFRSRYKLEGVLDVLDRMSSLDVLIIGDAILDDYHFCQPLGASSKDPALALQYESSDLFAGGVFAVANHVANFAHSVRLFTVLGEKDSQEGFINSKLHPKITSCFAYQDGAPTTVKRRFVESYTLNKILEIYIMDDSGLSEDKDLLLCEQLADELPKYDLVIASDFGHGAISQRARGVLVEKAPFLAVNTQANAGNRGFHAIGRYSRADYVSMAEPELRLESRDMRGELRTMMRSVSSRLGCDKFAVTRGKAGSLLMNGNDNFVVVPAFANKVVDRIGSGDAFFAITSLAARQNADLELIGFIGNVVGALAVEIIGNQKSIDKPSVNKYITSLLKWQ